mmetsp:Transcript_6479/g.11952  ORF Transcript_6479/g.11952 Transcript_6479/m.11952 type:complete len:647 (+) Transcript_6479:118-2058(+)
MSATYTPRGAAARSGQQLPFLPGYTPYDIEKTNFSKQQSLAFAPGGPIAFMKTDIPKLDLNVLQTMSDPSHRFNMSHRSVTHEERDSIRESARNTYRPAIAPAWLKHDRQVLRFYAYFQEPVHESPKENYRVRQCIIYFYLEDGTMMITEPKVENSGIPHGTFVKRHRIPRPKDMGPGYLQPQDLRLGLTIFIYSRAFRIVDCDDFTREFYGLTSHQGVGNSQDVPLDSFTSDKMQATMDTARVKAATNREIIEGKEYMELALGGSRRNAKLQQYLENDRKVLFFRAYWDDPTRYGSRMYYTIHYYLMDDTVEIQEKLPRNSGRDPYPTFFRRDKMRKNPHISPAPAMLEPEPQIYKPEDFVVGQHVTLYGRDLYLYECDDFTKEFYANYTGHQQQNVQIKEAAPVHVQLTHPPHTGFGTEEDSLASCLHLTPRPPRRDILKLMNQQGKVLRFFGQMANDREEDARRRFIVAIYLSDDSVGVWELRQRNSGHAEGKFALKTRKKNPATGTWFTPMDFQIGKIVTVNATPFFLLRADDATLKFMEANPQVFPAADVQQIAARLQPLAESLAANGGPTMEPEDLRRWAQESLGVEIGPHELVTLRRACGIAQDVGGEPAAEDAEPFEDDETEAPKLISTEKLLQLLSQ